jgi:hypothetical protein
MLASQEVTSSLELPRACEATEVHTRILRLALGIEDSRRYWEQVDPGVPSGDRARAAFEGRWFGAKSMERVRYLLTSFQARYDAFPNALAALMRWRGMDVPSRQVICHWHMQLSDPLYRRFADSFLNQRRALATPRVDRDAILRWLRTAYPERWAEATLVQFASKLLSAALEAGLVSKRDPRTLHFPKVGDLALGYLLYLLREIRFDGTLTANPYLRSVGLDEDLLFSRARALPGLRIRSMMHLTEMDWDYPDLGAWAREVLS